MKAFRHAACVLLAAIWATAGAQSTRIADWTFQKTAELQQAYTSSDTGASFGVFCYLKTQVCTVFLRTQNQCEDGTVTAMLMNASTGTASLTATCIKATGDDGKPIFINSIAEFDASIRGSQAGGDFGIAVPLVSGKFVVFRFSGRGASDAISAARMRPLSAPVKSGDQVL